MVEEPFHEDIVEEVDSVFEEIMEQDSALQEIETGGDGKDEETASDAAGTDDTGKRVENRGGCSAVGDSSPNGLAVLMLLLLASLVFVLRRRSGETMGCKKG